MGTKGGCRDFMFLAHFFYSDAGSATNIAHPLHGSLYFNDTTGESFNVHTFLYCLLQYAEYLPFI